MPRLNGQGVGRERHLLVGADGDDGVAVGRVAHAVDPVAVLGVGVVEHEGRAVVEDTARVLGGRDELEGPCGAVGRGDDALAVARQLAQRVARVPHEHLGILCTPWGRNGEARLQP